MQKGYYNKTIEEVCNEYEVNEEIGLTEKEVNKRQVEYGENMFTKVKEKSLSQELKETLTQQLIIILLIAAAISMLIKEYHDAIGICFAVLLSTTIGLLTESRSKKAAEALNRMSEDIEVKVYRGSHKKIVHKREIVPGDIVFLEAGDQVPADGRVIWSNELKVREDMLTGESDDVKKRDCIINEEEVMIDGKKIKQDPIPAKQQNMVFGGTLIASGQAKMIVTSIGDLTEMGSIAKELGHSDERTPLEMKMDTLAETISKISTMIAGMLFVYMFVQILGECRLKLDLSGVSQFFKSLKPLVGRFPDIKTAFVVCVALIVAAVPEGLPTMINMTLAITMKQMAKINVLVRKKEACETIGAVSVICSDKTGTLTQNKMKVAKIYIDGGFRKVDKLNEYPEFIRNCTVNSTADLEYHNNQINYIGSATECALLDLCSNYDYRKYRQVSSISKQIPFDSNNKYMMTILEEGTEYVVFSKGAPEVVLSQCGYEKIGGQIVSLTNTRKQKLVKEIEGLQQGAMRVLAFANKSIPSSYQVLKKERWENELIFEGFVGIQDPLREGVKEAVEIALEAGIETKMLTGDNIQTAIAIGKEIGLVGKHKKAVEASFIDTLSDEELKKEIKSISIVARSKPDTKLRIVKALQKSGEIVAVTGDGINDAPALTKADVGIAMGIAGTEVSKNAADIILIDDSFGTIVEAIKWGRGIYNNFQRFIQFQLTVNIIAFLIAIISQIMGYDMPFTTIHLLWINIIMDGPPALALGLEPIRETVMKRRPIKREKPIINHYMIRTILINSLFITGVLWLQIKYNFLGVQTIVVNGASEMQTVLFSLLAFSVLFNAFNCREFGTGSIFPNLFKNKLAVWIIFITGIIQIIITQCVSSFFNAVPLSSVMWIKVICVGSLVVVVNEVVKRSLRIAKYSAKTAVRQVKKNSIS